MTTSQIPDEALFFISENTYSIDQLLRVIYTNPSEQTRAHFVSVNAP